MQSSPSTYHLSILGPSIHLKIYRISQLTPTGHCSTDAEC